MRDGLDVLPGDRPPADLAVTSAVAWFQQRIGPLLGEALDEDVAGTWRTADVLPDEEELIAQEAAGLRRDGAPPKVVLTDVVSAHAGHSAAVVAMGVVRDGVLVRVARPGVLERLRHPHGWTADARLLDGQVAVTAGHPWAGRPGVEVLADRPGLEAKAIAEIVRAGAPAVELVARRSRRGRVGLWALVADAVGDTARRLPAGLPADAAVAATRRLLTAPGVPWVTPTMWTASTQAGSTLVVHRGSCCLYYQCDPEVAQDADQHADDPEHRAYLDRFGDDPPRYCSTCLHRSADDVQERLAFSHERAAAAAA